jgi:alcohol dehydrogenase (cytochrome c)
MKRFLACSALLIVAHITGSSAAEPPAPADFIPVTDAMLQQPADGDWLSWRRTLNSWGYSPLRQVNRRNVNRLALVWSRPLAPGIQEATPLVYNGVMYLPNPNDVIQAIDAASGDLIWEYRRKLPEDLGQYIPFPSINRNLAIYDKLIIDNGFDDYVYALDAATGKLVWETLLLDYRKAPSQQTSGPIIADGKIISGRGCEPNAGPAPCVITAHDALTGRELWRTGTIQNETGANNTWGKLPYPDRSHVGTWLVPSFDPELNLVLIGTSVTSPAPKFILGGNDQKHLYHNSTLALNADTGKIVWYYQHLVDHWDLDHTFERVLAEIKVTPDPSAVRWINPKLKPGERRKVVTGIPGKTGIVYTLDRATGEFLWATTTIQQTVVRDINGNTGAVTVNPEMEFHKVGDKRRVCPNTGGGKNWPAGAFNPDSNTLFYPLQNTCMDATAITDDPHTTELYGLLMEHMIAPGTDKLGTIHAISAETGKLQWKYEQRAATTALVATGGGLLFGGDINGRFRAFDQETGKIIWEINLGSQVTGYPITFAVNGRQYVAVSTGSGVATAQHLLLTPELRPGDDNTLFVFALPESR